MEQKLIDPDLPNIDIGPLTVAELDLLARRIDERHWNESPDDEDVEYVERRDFVNMIWVAASGWMLAVGALIALAVNRFPL
jgi:hypothetical protein